MPRRQPPTSDRDRAAGELWRLAQCAEMIAVFERGGEYPTDERGKIRPSRASLERVARDHPDLVRRAQ